MYLNVLIGIVIVEDAMMTLPPLSMLNASDVLQSQGVVQREFA